MRASIESPGKDPFGELSPLAEKPILSGAGMELKHVLAGTGATDPLAHPDTEISAVVYTSRQAVPGSLFVAIRGEKTDGNRFVFDAIGRGASVIVSEMPPPPDPAWDSLLTGAPQPIPPAVAWVRVPDARKALATIGANFFGRPADKLQLIGITGTNGKTTTSFLIDSMVRVAGHEAGLFGTIEYRTPLGIRPATTTTPESLDLQGFLSEVVHGGGTHAVLEASSPRARARSRLGLPLRGCGVHEFNA